MKTERAQVTTDEVMRLADEYAQAECVSTRNSTVDSSLDRDVLRTAVKQLVAERDAMKAACERVRNRLMLDVEDGSRPDQWTMEDMVRTIDAALKGKP